MAIIPLEILKFLTSNDGEPNDKKRKKSRNTGTDILN